MKKLIFGLFGVLCLMASASGQTTAFTYQGRLLNNSAPANGTYDMQFTLYDALSGGSQVGTPLTNSTVAVTNGLFTVVLDFGGGVFTGAGRWIQVGVRTNGSVGAYTILSPRQQISSTPYAIRAADAGSVNANDITGIISDSQLSSNIPHLDFPANFSYGVSAAAFFGDGSALTNIDALTLGGVGASGFWKTSGNAGTTSSDFLGTIDAQPLELRVNNVRGMKLIPTVETGTRVGIVNIANGSPANTISAGVYGGTIAGGGASNFDSLGVPNIVNGNFGTVGGGYLNSAGLEATVAGGSYNVSAGPHSSVAGGLQNSANGYWTSVGGGANNVAGGGSDYSAIAGGNENSLFGTWGFIGAGRGNYMVADFSTISGGIFNTNTGGTSGTIAGGFQNRISGGNRSVIGGGYANTNSGFAATIGGGQLNQNTGSDSTIGGGYGNKVSFVSSTVGGGRLNNAVGNFATIAGGSGNTANGTAATIAGGDSNSTTTNYATVAGGIYNSATNAYATVVGGYGNIAGGAYSLAGGQNARAIHDGSFVWADSQGPVFSSTVTNQFLVRARNGFGLSATGAVDTLMHIGSHGLFGQATNFFPNGTNISTSSGLFIETSIGGEGAGIFMNGDTLAMWSPGDNDLLRLYDEDVISNPSPAPLFRVDGSGNAYAVSFVSTSDRNAKENFSAVNSREILDKVTQLPIQKWNFKQQGDTHIGPMAQDFHAAFDVGPDDKHIATVDADGVALAAIQGLNEVVKEKDAQISALEKRLSELEILVKSLTKEK